MKTIAVLGTGTMGAPMARNLDEAGFDVRVWNRTREKAEEVGVTVCEDAKSCVADADIVITMLSDAEAVEAALDEAGQLPDGAVWVQASTVGVEAAEKLKERAGGALYVDAPMLGTKEPAEKGDLIVLASGDDHALDRCDELFKVIGAKTLRLGEAGAGSRLKLVVNTWLLTLVEGLAESVALAEGLGVDPAKFLEAIEGGPLFAPYAKLKGNAMINDEFPPSFSLALAAKDAALVKAAADGADLTLPLVDAVARQFAKGVDDGHGDQDMAATVRTARS